MVNIIIIISEFKIFVLLNVDCVWAIFNYVYIYILRERERKRNKHPEREREREKPANYTESASGTAHVQCTSKWSSYRGS